MTLLCALMMHAAAAPLPVTEAETLAGARISLPGVLGGKPAVLIWSFSREGGGKVKEWFAALEREAPGRIYSVAMLEAAPRLVRGLIRSGMRGDTPSALHGRVLLMYKAEQEWRARLGVKDGKVPVVLVVNRAAEPVWSREGAYSSAALVEVLAAFRGR